MKKLNAGEIIPMSRENTVLTEFSGRHSYEFIMEALQLLIQRGYAPLIAHMERYPAMRDLDRAEEIADLGVRIQVNAGSVLGREGHEQKKFVQKLMKRDLVFAVASDAHGVDFRPPELGECFQYLTKKLGRSYAEKVLCRHPYQILHP